MARDGLYRRLYTSAHESFDDQAMLRGAEQAG